MHAHRADRCRRKTNCYRPMSLSLPNSYFKALETSVAVFGDRVWEKVIKVK